MNYKNKKNGKIYTVLEENIINATNSNDGKQMILYTDNNGNLYVRECSEFRIKFDKCLDIKNSPRIVIPKEMIRREDDKN